MLAGRVPAQGRGVPLCGCFHDLIMEALHYAEEKHAQNVRIIHVVQMFHAMAGARRRHVRQITAYQAVCAVVTAWLNVSAPVG